MRSARVWRPSTNCRRRSHASWGVINDDTGRVRGDISAWFTDFWLHRVNPRHRITLMWVQLVATVDKWLNFHLTMSSESALLASFHISIELSLMGNQNKYSTRITIIILFVCFLSVFQINGLVPSGYTQIIIALSNFDFVCFSNKFQLK